MNKIGNWWNDKSIEIYNINGRNIALYGWNGEKYMDCFEVTEDLFDIIKENIVVKPIYNKPIHNSAYQDEYKIVDYEIIEG